MRLGLAAGIERARQSTCWQRSAEAGAALGQFEREIGQFGPVARPLAQDERLHQGDALASVLCRF